jgi:hypothetical protein
VGVARVHVAGLRESPYAAKVETWLQDNTSSGEGTTAQDEALESTRVVVMGLSRVSDDPDELQMVTVMKGDYRQGLFDEYVHEQIDGEADFKTEQRRGHEVHASQQVAMTELDRQTWLFATEGAMDAALGRVDEPSAGPLSKQPLKGMAKQADFGSSAVDAVFEVTDSIREQLGQVRTPIRPELLQAIQRGSLQVNVADGVRMRVVAKTGKKGDAKALGGEVDQLVQQYGSHPVAQMLGLDVLASSTRVKSDGRKVVLRTDLGDAETRELLAQLERLGQMVQQMEGAQQGKGRGGTRSPKKSAPPKQ